MSDHSCVIPLCFLGSIYSTELGQDGSMFLLRLLAALRVGRLDYIYVSLHLVVVFRSNAFRATDIFFFYPIAFRATDMLFFLSSIALRGRAFRYAVTIVLFAFLSVAF